MDEMASKMLAFLSQSVSDTFSGEAILSVMAKDFSISDSACS